MKREDYLTAVMVTTIGISQAGIGSAGACSALMLLVRCGGWLERVEISEMLGCSYQSAGNWMDRLRVRGLVQIETRGGGKYYYAATIKGSRLVCAWLPGSPELAKIVEFFDKKEVRHV